MHNLKVTALQTIPKPGIWTVGEQDTPVGLLRRVAEVTPDRQFLDFSGDRYTYGDVDRLTNQFGHSVVALGVEPGQTVLTMFNNNVDAVVAWLGINKARAVSVPVNTALRGEFLRHQISDSSAAVVACEAEYLERIVAIADKLPEMKVILYRGTLPIVPEVPGVRIEAFEEHRGSDATPFEQLPQPQDLAGLIYTSGTTGPSKGCMLSHNYMCNLARLQLAAAPARPDDVVWTPLPLFHFNAIATGIISTMMVGASIAISPRFSVSGFWPEIERSGATVVSILGAMGNMLAKADDNEAMKRSFGQVHTVRGNPFTEEMKTIWRERFGAKQIGSNGYGLTEAAVITTLKAGEFAAPGSSGKRTPMFDVRIFDDHDQEVPIGQTGEIVCRPLCPNVMFQGYWQRPAETMKVFGNMWFHTGDIGRFDADGFFYFVDRKKDYIRRRGENISSFEVESTFSNHPDIEDLAVHAVPSPVGEDDVKLTAILRAGATTTPEELCRWSLSELPYYAVPRYIEFRDQLPKNPQGRVLKYLLREDGCTPTTFDIEKSDIKIVKR